MTAPLLTITPGTDLPYALSFASEDQFGALWPIERIGEYGTLEEAGAAYRAGLKAADDLSRIGVTERRAA